MNARCSLLGWLAAVACSEPEPAGGGGAGGAADGGHGGAGDGGGATQGGGGSGDGGGGSGGGGAPAGPPPGNAVLLSDGTIGALYPTQGAALPTTAIGFRRDGEGVTAFDEHGATLWQADLGPGSLFGGFDFDQDGVPDLGLVRFEDSGSLCGGQVMWRTSLDVAAGSSGELFPYVPATDALCWNFSGTIYPTTQWSDLGVLFGGSSPALASAPYYATEGAVRSFNGAAFDVLGTFAYPSTPTFDASYPAAEPNAWGHGVAYLANSHVANGLVMDVAGEPLVVFFTSGRVVAYRPEALSASQLVFDRPFLSGGRTDLAGRNYGLVAPDPGAPDRLVLIGGTSADTLRDDMMSGTLSADPWGQIERHVAIVDVAAGTVSDRFFSYAHDGGDAYQYEGRVVYPNNPFVRELGPSRLAFNVYEGGRWHVHVTAPGDTATALVIADRFLWDIADLDQDSVEEWVLSPTRDPDEPDVAGYYFAKWRTLLAHFEAGSLVETATFEGKIPYLVPTFRRPDRSTSRSFLYPALVERRADGSLGLLLAGPDGAPTSVDL
ncbi:MAG: hypothetical protein IPM79_19765 [Polyangiaceae bacterium]|jgi:hypothetical protein|nr:hypothetical protein [Polyangiaceae bacterium]